jgi:hypothetical protein
MRTLTTSEVAARLDVAQPTVKLWCRQGKFPGAAIQETPRGPVWLIPEGDLKDFVPPKRGRIPKPKASGTDGEVKVKADKKGKQ